MVIARSLGASGKLYVSGIWKVGRGAGSELNINDSVGLVWEFRAGTDSPKRSSE